MLELPEGTADAIRALDEHWDGAGQPFGLRGERDPAARPDPVPGADARGVRAHGRPARRAARWRSSAAAAGSTPRWSTRCCRCATTARSGGRSRTRARSRPWRSWEPAERVLTAGDDRLDRVADAFARVIDAKSPFTARHSAEVAALGGRHRRRHGPAAGRPARPAARRRCCTTSASSRSPTGSSTSPAGSTRTSSPRSASTRATRSRSSSAVACLRGIVDTAASHHERLDGSGYHRGLSAFDLSRPARILAVADIYEALTADRPYREAMPRERALEILREQRGTGLCPASVDALAERGDRSRAGQRILGFRLPGEMLLRRTRLRRRYL